MLSGLSVTYKQHECVCVYKCAFLIMVKYRVCMCVSMSRKGVDGTGEDKSCVVVKGQS